MPTNNNVLVSRERYIGGSEIASILGISPFRTRWQLLQEKVGVSSDFHGNIYTEYGEILEPQIRDFINASQECLFLEDTIIQEHEIINYRCNYDGLDREKGIVLEIKTTSQIHDDIKDYEYYVCQVLWGMKLANIEQGILAVYERETNEDGTFNTEFHKSQLSVYPIERKDWRELEERIDREVELFVRDLAKLKENPFLTEEDLLSNELVALGNQVEIIEQQLVSFHQIEKQYEELKKKLYEAMDNNNIKSWTTNNGTKITKVAGRESRVEIVNKFNEAKFIAENKDLYNKYVEQVEKEIKGVSGYVKITLPK